MTTNWKFSGVTNCIHALNEWTTFARNRVEWLLFK